MKSYIFDKKSIMSAAWASAKKKFAKPSNTRTLRQCLAISLRYQWSLATYAFERSEKYDAYVAEAISRKRKYVALLETVQGDSANHGRSWECDSIENKFVDGVFFQAPEHFLGKAICYVYPAMMEKN
nr:hypothetical protein [uncultured Enterobacter sp.]